MSSTSSFGTSQITLQFDLSRKIDAAAQDVQAAINAAAGWIPVGLLPSPPTYHEVNPADTPVLILALTSDTLPLHEVNDYAETVIVQKLSQVSGVGAVTIEGGQTRAVRLQANPAQLAGPRPVAGGCAPRRDGGNDGRRRKAGWTARGKLSPSAPTTSYSPPRAIRTWWSPIATARRCCCAISATPSTRRECRAGRLVQRRAGRDSRHPAPARRQHHRGGGRGASALLPKLRASLPPALKISVVTDRTVTIRAAIADVQFTLVLTVALVVLVIFLFLRKLWATVIPSVTLPVSLIATFGGMALFGFSLDNLSLMALTIASGFVVDDAIVMIENIVRYIEARRAAARRRR